MTAGRQQKLFCLALICIHGPALFRLSAGVSVYPKLKASIVLMRCLRLRSGDADEASIGAH